MLHVLLFYGCLEFFMQLAPITNLERKSKWIMGFHSCRHSNSGFFEVEFLWILFFTFFRLILAEDAKKKRYSPWKLPSVCRCVIQTISSIPSRIEMILKSNFHNINFDQHYSVTENIFLIKLEIIVKAFVTL